MGFHIVNLENNQLKHLYVQHEDELIDVEFINEDTIIYQGEKNWFPIRIGDSVKFRNYSKDWFRAGLKAQKLFKRHAKSEDLIVEDLSQDAKSFKQYVLGAKYIPIKRGDFLIRNYGNLEVEVKCRNFYEANGAIVFNFKCDDLDRHFNMQGFTKTPIILAIYDRSELESINVKPYFISVDEVNKHKGEFNKIYIRKDKVGDCYQIPLSYTLRCFLYIKEFSF